MFCGFTRVSKVFKFYFSDLFPFFFFILRLILESNDKAGSTLISPELIRNNVSVNGVVNFGAQCLLNVNTRVLTNSLKINTSRDETAGASLVFLRNSPLSSLPPSPDWMGNKQETTIIKTRWAIPHFRRARTAIKLKNITHLANKRVWENFFERNDCTQRGRGEEWWQWRRG